MTTEVDPELVRLLEPGEVVLWAGRPHYRHFRSEAWAAFVFGLIALAASAGAWVMSYLVVRTCFLPALFLTLIPAVMFGRVAVGCLSTPWACRRWLARAFYAVTDRRVIVRGGPGYARSAMVPRAGRDLLVFTPEQARAREVRQRHGTRVDLVLGTVREFRSCLDVGILGAEDWGGADRAMRAAFGR